MRNGGELILKGLGLRKGVIQRIKYSGKERDIEILGLRKGKNGGLLLKAMQYKRVNKKYDEGAFRYFKVSKMEVLNEDNGNQLHKSN